MLRNIISVVLITSCWSSIAAAPTTTTSAVKYTFDPTDAPVLFAGQASGAASSAASSSDEDEANPKATTSFGAAGSWQWHVVGSWISNFDRDNFGKIGGGVDWFFLENISMGLSLDGSYYDQVGENAWGIGLNLLFRWHFLTGEKWSIYVDGGCGILGTTNDVPFNGSSFNFTPQAGAGFTYEICEGTRLMTGARWYHISNARTYSENPGLDAMQLYGGVTFSF